MLEVMKLSETLSDTFLSPATSTRTTERCKVFYSQKATLQFFYFYFIHLTCFAFA